MRESRLRTFSTMKQVKSTIKTNWTADETLDNTFRLACCH